MVNAVDDLLHAAFPPLLPQMQHVVIDARAAREFSRRTGLSCRVVPNIMDFDNPPEFAGPAGAFRAAIGLPADNLLLLQPTRVVHRKGIKRSIKLLHELDDPPAKLVITH